MRSRRTRMIAKWNLLWFDALEDFFLASHVPAFLSLTLFFYNFYSEALITHEYYLMCGELNRPSVWTYVFSGFLNSYKHPDGCFNFPQYAHGK